LRISTTYHFKINRNKFYRIISSCFHNKLPKLHKIRLKKGFNFWMRRFSNSNKLLEHKSRDKKLIGKALSKWKNQSRVSKIEMKSWRKSERGDQHQRKAKSRNTNSPRWHRSKDEISWDRFQKLIERQTRFPWWLQTTPLTAISDWLTKR